MNPIFVKDLNEGAFVQGHNESVDGAETIWHIGGYFPWSSFGENAIVKASSDNAADDVSGIGARSLLVEGLKKVTLNGLIGYQLQSEIVPMNGIGDAIFSKEYSYITRCRPFDHGSANANVGEITITHDVTPISKMPAGENRIADAVFVIPHFTTQGTPIQGAYIIQFYVYIFEKSNATIMFELVNALPDRLAFAAVFRGTATIDSPFIGDLSITRFFLPGTKLEMRAIDVSATGQDIFCGVHLHYQLG